MHQPITCRRRRFIAAAALLPIAVHAQDDYPKKAIRMVIPFAAGGAGVPALNAVTHVPYKGAAQVMTDLISGQVQAIFGNAIFAPAHTPGVVIDKLYAALQAAAQRPRDLGQGDSGRPD